MSDRTGQPEAHNLPEWNRAWGGIGIGGVVVAYFASPLLRYVDPATMLFAAMALSIGVVYWHDAWSADKVTAKRKIWFGIAAFAASAWAGAPEIRDAINDVRANDKRCAAVQMDMLSAHPRRADSPDLFQALGCRPQGQGGVSAPPTDRERRAGHPLSWGGYPPPIR